MCKTGVGVYESSRVTAHSSFRLLDQIKQVWDAEPAERFPIKYRRCAWFFFTWLAGQVLSLKITFSARFRREHNREITFIWVFCQITKYHTQKCIWKTLKTFLRAASYCLIFTPIHLYELAWFTCTSLSVPQDRIVWLVFLLPEWLISLSIPLDPMVWMALPLPEWLVSLSIPLDPMAWAGTAAAWMVDISLYTIRYQGLGWHCRCLNGWYHSLYH